MRLISRRGSALMTAISALAVIFTTGAGVLSLSMQSMRRGRFDVLRARSMALADAGVEKAIYYLRTTAPNGATDGSWRTAGLKEVVDGLGDYTMVVQDGTGGNAGKIVITCTGRASDATQSGGVTPEVRRAVRVVLKLEREDVSVWNNAIFGGVGQSGKSINGNVRIRGGVHLLGDGESFTDVDGDGRWDAGEPYTDTNKNGVYDLGEPYSDLDGDGRRDAREPFDDVNGNGTRDPALTVTDLSSEFGGSANIGNNYNGMPSSLRARLPTFAPVPYGGESVESLAAKLRVKHGQVSINGSATVGNPNAIGGNPPVKETLDGTFVSDGFTGNAGTSQVHSDNGHRSRYNLGNIVKFPTLTEPAVVNGVSYPSYMNYLQSQAMVINGPITLRPGSTYGPYSDGRGNSISVDSGGNIVIQGIVYINGDLTIQVNGGKKAMTYTGRGTIVSTGNISLQTDLLPLNGSFPVNHAIGFVARRDMDVGTTSQRTMAAAFYAQQKIRSSKQNELGGTFVSSYYEMQNVPHMYQVPALPDFLPPGMPGAGRIWVKLLRIDSWREVTP